MTKIVAWLALGISVVSGVAVPMYMHRQTQAAIDRALRQREAQLIQRYAPLLGELADNTVQRAALVNAITIEELMDRAIGVARSEAARRRSTSMAVEPPVELAIPSHHTMAQFASEPIATEVVQRRAPASSRKWHEQTGSRVERSKPEQASSGSTEGGQIAFVSDDNGQSEIFVVNADGTGLRQITTNNVLERNPVWGPRGEFLVYAVDSDQIHDIYLLDQLNREPRRLTNDSNAERGLAVSPNGQFLAYTISTKDSSAICVIRADGGGGRTILATDACNPTWSPDGNKIAFTEMMFLATVNAGGGSPQFVLDPAEHSAMDLEFMPRWSPDGAHILFTTVSRASESEGSATGTSAVIDVVGVHDHHRTHLTKREFARYALDWSPDGSRILYGSNELGNSGLFTMKSDGSDQRRLTEKQPREFWASWTAATAVLARR